MKGVASALVVLALAACGTKTEPTAAPITTTTTTVAPTTTTTVTPDTDAICETNPELTSCGGEGPTKAEEAEIAAQARLDAKCAKLQKDFDFWTQAAADHMLAGGTAIAVRSLIRQAEKIERQMKELGC